MSQIISNKIEELTEKDMINIAGGQGANELAKIPCPSCNKAYTIMELEYKHGELYCPNCGAYVTWIDIG